MCNEGVPLHEIAKLICASYCWLLVIKIIIIIIILALIIKLTIIC